MKKFTNPWEELKEALRQYALNSGFDAVGFAPPAPPPHAEQLQPWLDQGCHGEMSWMERHPERRMDPRELLNHVGVILVAGVNYRPAFPSDGIAAYALHQDYHELLKNRVQELKRWLEEKWGQPVVSRICVDTAPVLEKPLAVAAGLGWQGKNTLLVSRDFGCWMMLAELFLVLPLPPDQPESDHCASCDRCLRACPTDALTTPYQVNASRCLAFFTVEARGMIPRVYREAMGMRVFGCDACITACPWNRFAPVNQEVTHLSEIGLVSLHLADWATLNKERFDKTFHATPILRLGVTRFLRNVATALGNWRTPEAVPPLERLLNHDAPLVRSHAAWGLGNLATHGLTDAYSPAQNDNAVALARSLLRRHQLHEQNQTVLEEINHAYARQTGAM
ncbi:MAG: tRNA epoxyqueuosine(34) reductase QueG [Magnetococcus sp. YQC-5]